jgi:uncharacterized protein (TIGR02266 family)
MTEMDPEAGASSSRRAFPRVPLRAKVRMEFAEQRCFLSEWAVNLSPGGMFVRTEAPVMAGQRFHFDAGLTAKGPRFEGVGEVMWVRREWEGTARPPGFAVRFLELHQDGVDAMQRLADVFLDKGVGAMQEELQAMAAAWHRRHLEEESTDEMQPPVREVDTPLPETAVVQAPWLAGDEQVTVPLAQVEETSAAGEGAASVDLDREITAPVVVEPAPAPPEPGEPLPHPPGRRRVWWVGGVALLLTGSAYLVLQGPLGGRLDGVSAGPAGESVLQPAPRAMPAAARRLAGAASFGGLDAVRWSEEDRGLWVVLDLDGALPPGSLSRLRFEEDHPREVIRLVGARHAYNPAVTPVGSPLLERIRVGFHPAYDGTGPAGDELRVVLDLTSAAVVVSQVLAAGDGRSLRLLLVRDEAAAARLAAAPAAAAAAPAEAAAVAAPAAVPTAPAVAPTPPR